MTTIWFLVYLLDPSMQPIGPFKTQEICERVLERAQERAEEQGQAWGDNFWQCQEH